MHRAGYDVAVRLQNRVREVLVSNLGQDTGFLAEVFRAFPSAPPS
jgi:hypothetical protein